MSTDKPSAWAMGVADNALNAAMSLSTEDERRVLPRIAAALDAAREDGRRAGLEKAATTTRLLEVLAALDDDVLVSVYDITRCNAPLDAAVYAWRDAGCPDAPHTIATEDAPRG